MACKLAIWRPKLFHPLIEEEEEEKEKKKLDKLLNYCMNKTKELKHNMWKETELISTLLTNQWSDRYTWNKLFSTENCHQIILQHLSPVKNIKLIVYAKYIMGV